MAIKQVLPPKSASDAATQRLVSLEHASGRIPDLEAGGGILANPQNCLPIYHLSSNKINSIGTPLSAALPTGWQYLVGRGEDAKSVEVIDDNAVAVDRGQVALNILNAIKAAERNTSDAQYEARMLTFGRVENPVLWLHPQEGGSERFFSLDPVSVEVEPRQILSKVSSAATVRQNRSSATFVEDNESGG
jgi:hypothetical protein